jgi:hypothetical protein
LTDTGGIFKWLHKAYEVWKQASDMQQKAHTGTLLEHLKDGYEPGSDAAAARPEHLPDIALGHVLLRRTRRGCSVVAIEVIEV